MTWAISSHICVLFTTNRTLIYFLLFLQFNIVVNIFDVAADFFNLLVSPSIPGGLMVGGLTKKRKALASLNLFSAFSGFYCLWLGRGDVLEGTNHFQMSHPKCLRFLDVSLCSSTALLLPHSIYCFEGWHCGRFFFRFTASRLPLGFYAIFAIT